VKLTDQGSYSIFETLFSFPSGGIRKTHTAAAYTSWDITSPPFVIDDVLFIPSAFIAWTGESLDLKTPLLRSNDAINKQALRLLRHLGDKETTHVNANVGWEQEFFVIDRDNFTQRLDLLQTGRTIFGNTPSLGQQTEKHYFGNMPKRVREYLRDVQKELWRLGIAEFTLHNEVAPSQYEICPIYHETNVSCDQNTLAMEVLESFALKHGLACLMHEKPFKGLNGSGKHNNWSLSTNNGDQLFSPGKTKFEQERFIVFLSCVSRALNHHGDIIRLGIANSGNDYRLGAQEAPPSIISLYTGHLLESHLKDILEKDAPLDGYGNKTELLNFGTNSILEIDRNIEDRNRTASFPLCSNRFEFRAVGSSQNIAWPLTMINTAVADSLSHLSDLIEGGKSIKNAVKEVLSENMKVVFNGNGYSKEWEQEANKRGLWNLPQTVDALDQLDSKKNQKLFESTKIFTKRELESRKEVLLENYIKSVMVEVDCMIKMVSTGFIPACFHDLKNLENSKSKTVQRAFESRDTLYSKLEEENSLLIAMYEKISHDDDLSTQARYVSGTLKNQMNKVREIVDCIEKVLPNDLYPFPKYEQILYDHHFNE
jgi:glutamine synthetase